MAVASNKRLVPPLLALTVLTGVVDAVSFLALGRVFVANMTGNVVFLGFAIAGAPGLSVTSSLVAIAAFLVGAGCGGALGRRITVDRTLLRTATAAGMLLVAIALVVSIGDGEVLHGARRYAVLVVLGLAMGGQNAVARHLAVPDMTTTVLTLTITGLAADSRLAGGQGGPALRRLMAAGAMFAGAVGGALLTLNTSVTAALALALGVGTVAFVLNNRP